MNSIAILLLNLGGPDSIKSIKPFLVNLFSDSDIIKLPAQPLTARFIATRRAKKVIPRYEQIGGSSPINKETDKQAFALEKLLNESGSKDKFKTFIGMRYWHPLIDETLDKIFCHETKFEKLIVLPLFPQYSRTTTGSCFNQVKNYIKNKNSDKALSADVIYINNWHDNSIYIDALAKKIDEGFVKFKDTPKENIHVVFSSHSIPKKFIDDGDPYKEQIEKTIALVVSKTKIHKYSVAYQSRSGPVKWLEPDTKDVLKKLALTKKKAIMIVPISFVSDHIETLYEIDIMLGNMCKSLGVEQFIRTPSLDADPLFIKALANIIKSCL